MTKNAAFKWDKKIDFVPHHIQPIGDEVYVSGVGQVAVFDRETGELLRERPKPDLPVFPVYFPDAFTDDLWLIPSRKYGVTAINRHDQNLATDWVYRAGDGECGVAVDGDMAYICCWYSYPGESVGSINQVSIIDGRQNWSVPVESFSSAPIVYGDTVCAGLANGMVWAGCKDTGKEQWRQPGLGRVGQQGNITHVNSNTPDKDDVLYLNNDNQGNKAGAVYCLNAATGGIEWSGPVKLNPYDNAFLYADRVYTVTCDPDPKITNFFVYGFDAANGDHLMVMNIKIKELSKPALNGRLTVHDDFLIIQMGKRLFAMEIADPCNTKTLYSSNPAGLLDYRIDNNVLYVALKGPGMANSIRAISL